MYFHFKTSRKAFCYFFVFYCHCLYLCKVRVSRGLKITLNPPEKKSINLTTLLNDLGARVSNTFRLFRHQPYLRGVISGTINGLIVWRSNGYP